jgi:uncharacterized phage protein (TIGR01671 family)
MRIYVLDVDNVRDAGIIHSIVNNGRSSMSEREIKFRYTYSDSIGGFMSIVADVLSYAESSNGSVCDLATAEMRNKTISLKLVGRDQYTGHQDDNGVDIYDGDIVRSERVCGDQTEIVIGVVKYGSYEVHDMLDCGSQYIEGFHADCYSIYRRAWGRVDKYEHQYPFPLGWYFKVVGNIHTTPELMETDNG